MDAFNGLGESVVQTTSQPPFLCATGDGLPPVLRKPASKMPSSRNILILSVVHLSERMTLDEIRPLAAPNSFSQSEAREAINPGRSNIITQKSYKRACALGPTVQSGAYT